MGMGGAEEVMKLRNKRLSEEVVREFVPRMQDLGISIYASFMVGVPGETAEMERDTIRMIEDLAGYRPDLFEYFVSYCDVTRVTPFARGTEDGARPHDGQSGIANWIAPGDGDFSDAAGGPPALPRGGGGTVLE